MKTLHRIVAGIGLWALVAAGIGLIIQYLQHAELSTLGLVLSLLMMLMGSVVFTVYHDSEGK